MTKSLRAFLLFLPLLITSCASSFDAVNQLQDKNILVTAHYNDEFTAIYQGVLGTKTKTLDIKQWKIDNAVAAALAKSLTAQGYNASSGRVMRPGDIRLAILPESYKDYIWRNNQQLRGLGVYRLFEMIDEHVIAFNAYKIIVLDGDKQIQTLYGQFKVDMGKERWADETYWESPIKTFPQGVESLYRRVFIQHFETLNPFSLPSVKPRNRRQR